MEKMKTQKVKPLTILFQEIIKMVEKMEKDKEGYTTKDYLDALANRVDIIENAIGEIKTDLYAIEERAHNTDDEIARLDADIDAIYSGTLADDEEDKEKEIHKVGGTDSEEEEEDCDGEWWLCKDEDESKHHTINMNITIGADSPLNEDFFERLYDLVEKSKKNKTTK